MEMQQSLKSTSKYFNRKDRRGTWRDGHWVFGGVEKITGKCFLVEVPDRSAATLESLIFQHILTGIHIMSDGWAAYRGISGLFNRIYMHFVVVHDQQYVDHKDSDLQTQVMENLLIWAKRKLKCYFGTSSTLFSSYLHEFEFRNEARGRILRVLAELYIV